MDLSALDPTNKIPVEIKSSTITKIQVAKDNLERLKRFIESRCTSPEAKYNMQRKIVGLCSSCGGIPEFILTKYYDGLHRTEKYCNTCLEQKDRNVERDKEILTKLQVVESVSEFTKLHKHEQRPIDQ